MIDSASNTLFRGIPCSRPICAASSGWKYPIDEAIGENLFFYGSQRLATPATDSRRVSWRGESPPNNAGGDFHGGWYDAGIMSKVRCRR
jgi:hypothetical protein